jgi:hypothetical protein
VRFSRLDTGASTAAKKAFIAQRQAYGQSVVYFGDCQRERVLAEAADVAVMVADKHHRVNAEAPIVFLSPDLEKFSSLHSLCEKRNSEVKGAFALATIPNVAANRRGRGSELAGLGFRCNDNARNRYLLLQSVSASATGGRGVGTSSR